MADEPELKRITQRPLKLSAEAQAQPVADTSGTEGVHVSQAQPVEGTRERLEGAVGKALWEIRGHRVTGRELAMFADSLLRDFTVTPRRPSVAEIAARESTQKLGNVTTQEQLDAAAPHGMDEAFADGAPRAPEPPDDGSISLAVEDCEYRADLSETRAPEPYLRKLPHADDLGSTTVVEYPDEPADAPKSDRLLEEAQVIAAMICRGCVDHLPLQEGLHVYADGMAAEECIKDIAARKLAEFAHSVRQRDREKVKEWRKMMHAEFEGTGYVVSKRFRLGLEHGPEWEE